MFFKRRTFTHNTRLDPAHVAPATRRIHRDHDVMVEVRGDKIAAERVYGVLRQAGLLNAAKES